MYGIDAHLHLDQYDKAAQEQIISELSEHKIKGVVAVSMNLGSCMNTYQLAEANPGKIYPAFGFHPEQPLPSEKDIDLLFQWIFKHQEIMVAIGEVGLPYYERTKAEEENRQFELAPYIHLLEKFILLAKEINKPIVLHSVYEDAVTTCELLEKHRIKKAHFHWYKGSASTTKRLMNNGYFISITPDVFYEKDIQELVKKYPLEQMMVETDGPWPFEGPFAHKMTHPKIIHEVIPKIAEIKNLPLKTSYERIMENTIQFYDLK
ncbi:TatD family hydrolase [Fictibacillus gelatini]|uniref:TatD family hydrolase n=1 Tax=Fictibacillus gelatini TaxID=225985 RepID=UPI000408DF42|nr:TatD family hydrolase [Fictibacillus gelatini]